ncbi:hypothetical protein B0H19DRAFT_1066011 [Mycena capillaripes]|nr:hypothetical protein B0H19DRAFT_1066011 [Mycena capillaripes]
MATFSARNKQRGPTGRQRNLSTHVDNTHDLIIVQRAQLLIMMLSKRPKVAKAVSTRHRSTAALHDKDGLGTKSVGKAVYPNPHEFKPEHFLLDGKLDPAAEDPMSAVGYGRRLCPGRHLATATLWIGIHCIQGAPRLRPIQTYTQFAKDCVGPGKDLRNPWQTESRMFELASRGDT